MVKSSLNLETQLNQLTYYHVMSNHIIDADM